MQRRQFMAGLGALGAIGMADVAGAQGSPDATGIENIILAVGDGMGFDPIEVTSVVHDDLTLQSMTPVGYTRTHSRSGPVTDSAAAGTALATGIKAYNGQVSVRGPDGSEDVTPLTTIAEMASQLGKATGLVSTTRITHATPAVFGSHIHNRDLEPDIADQYIDQGVDVLLGGGRREWSDDHLSAAREAGYELCMDRSDLQTAGDAPVLGLFDTSHVTYTLDRDGSIPSLVEMTQAAVDRLVNNNGFFLMVEGGRIDHAEHGNDIQTTVSETKEFDDVVAWCREFVANRDDTLLVVVSDHETGGLATGNDYGDPIDEAAIRDASGSNGAIATAIKNGTPVRAAVNQHVDVELSDADVERIRDAKTSENPYALSNTLGAVISDHLGVSWASNKHTGPAQTVLAAGPGVEPSVDWYHHTDVSTTLAALLLFGQVPNVTDAALDNWEQQIRTSGPSGTRDAQLALQYLGPVDDSITEALDRNGDGIVDYADILAIATGSSNRRPAQRPQEQLQPTRGRITPDQYHEL